MTCHPERSGSESSREVEGPDRVLLLARVLGKDRAWLIAHPEAQLTHEEEREYDALLARRETGEPIAYVTGEAWFYGRRFEVNPSVLIPRPETEHLVDEALAFLRAFQEKNPARAPVVLDAGTGSGAIAITIAAEVPSAVVHATERSPAALEVALRNARALVGPSTTLATFATLGMTGADLFPSDASLRFDCAIANLPYIPSDDVPQKPDPVGFEPREAVDGGPDGLREYRRLLEMLPPRLNAGALVLLEAAPPTIRELERLAARAFPAAKIAVKRDYAGLERYVAVRTG